MYRIALLALLVPSALRLCATTVTFTAGCTSGEAGITSTITFDGAVATDPAGHATYTGAQFNNGTNPCGSDFLGISSSTTTILFDQPIDYFGFAWGTPDPNNNVEFFNGATSLFLFSGATAAPTYVNVFAGAGEQFTRIVFSYEGCCFETDNHSYRLAPGATLVPEPSSLSVALLGLGFLAWQLHLKKR